MVLARPTSNEAPMLVKGRETAGRASQGLSYPNLRPHVEGTLGRSTFVGFVSAEGMEKLTTPLPLLKVKCIIVANAIDPILKEMRQVGIRRVNWDDLVAKEELIVEDELWVGWIHETRATEDETGKDGLTFFLEWPDLWFFFFRRPSPISTTIFSSSMASRLS